MALPACDHDQVNKEGGKMTPAIGLVADQLSGNSPYGAVLGCGSGRGSSRIHLLQKVFG